ncbi:MAG: hypothetical protein JXA20_13895 [Spirochaetes bacterium]|nr:hypothetical protein [Spirochaetota bacterium]
MNTGKAVPLFLAVLALHVAHMFEEVWGRFWLMDAVFGPGWYLAINWLLFCVPVALFYFVLRGRRWAHHLGMAYAGLMALNGVGHNAATIVTGRYFGGFAGGVSGIGLLLAGVPLVYCLWRERPAASG